MLLTELADLPAIPLDAEGMHQAVHNIMLNAIDAAPSDTGRVTVHTHYDSAAGVVLVGISDNGPGIPPGQIDLIFDAFHSSKGHAGTGLGLAAARKVVDELNGVIKVESSPGQGTTFQIRLPAIHVRLADSEETHGLGR